MLLHFKESIPFKIVPAMITTIVLFTLLLIPCPGGLTPKAWALVAIFLTTIVAIILKVMPIGVMALMAIVIVALSQVTSTSSKGAIADALSSFSSPLIWLIVVSVIFSFHF
jgi:DASS family divalent anion:Na+ symporter